MDAELNGGADRKEAATAAAEFIRDGLVKLGPTFVKLGQVVSTRTDIFSDAYISVLKTLQDDVPAFSGKRAMAIIEKELGLAKITDKFEKFSEEPLAAASLGQVSELLEAVRLVALRGRRRLKSAEGQQSESVRESVS